MVTPRENFIGVLTQHDFDKIEYPSKAHVPSDQKLFRSLFAMACRSSEAWVSCKS